MGRGGAKRGTPRGEPERRCAVSGARGPAAALVRFALSPDGVATPDVAGKLPGRGVWVSADKALLAKAAKKNVFARGFKAPARAPDDLPERVEALLAQRLVAAIALCRKAGVAVAGFEKAKSEILARAPEEIVLIQACDGAPDGLRKLHRLARGSRRLTCLDQRELGLAFGRPYVIHAVLVQGGAAGRVLTEAARLQAIRGLASADDAPEDGATVAATSHIGSDDDAAQPPPTAEAETADPDDAAQAARADQEHRRDPDAPATGGD